MEAEQLLSRYAGQRDFRGVFLAGSRAALSVFALLAIAGAVALFRYLAR